MPANGSWLVRLRSGDLTTVAALGPLNPLEYADLRPSADQLAPVLDATGGGLFAIGEGTDARLPDLRRTRLGADQAGRGWLGLQRNERYIVRTSQSRPVLPALIIALLIAAFMGLGWWREGK